MIRCACITYPHIGNPYITNPQFGQGLLKPAPPFVIAEPCV